MSDVESDPDEEPPLPLFEPPLVGDAGEAVPEEVDVADDVVFVRSMLDAPSSRCCWSIASLSAEFGFTVPKA